jgi:hypothetical protein
MIYVYPAYPGNDRNVYIILSSGRLKFQRSCACFRRRHKRPGADALPYLRLPAAAVEACRQTLAGKRLPAGRKPHEHRAMMRTCLRLGMYAWAGFLFKYTGDGAQTLWTQVA